MSGSSEAHVVTCSRPLVLVFPRWASSGTCCHEAGRGERHSQGGGDEQGCTGGQNRRDSAVDLKRRHQLLQSRRDTRSCRGAMAIPDEPELVVVGSYYLVRDRLRVGSNTREWSPRWEGVGLDPPSSAEPTESGLSMTSKRNRGHTSTSINRGRNERDLTAQLTFVKGNKKHTCAVPGGHDEHHVISSSRPCWK